MAERNRGTGLLNRHQFPKLRHAGSTPAGSSNGCEAHMDEHRSFKPEAESSNLSAPTTYHMRIPIETSVAMFVHAGVNREKLHDVLRHMAPYSLKGAFRKDWRADNPTRNFCYVVSEWLIHYVAPAGSLPFRMTVPGEANKHYFVRWADGTLVDLTAEQFDAWETLDYTTAKKASFMFPSPSSRTKVLDTLMQLHTGNVIGYFTGDAK